MPGLLLFQTPSPGSREAGDRGGRHVLDVFIAQQRLIFQQHQRPWSVDHRRHPLRGLHLPGGGGLDALRPYAGLP